MTAPSTHHAVAATLAVVVSLVGLAACSTSTSGDKSDGQEATEQTQPEVSSLMDLADQLPNSGHPFDDVVTAGQPSRQQLELAADHVETVVNFRPHDEKGAWDEVEMLREMDVTYVHIPIAGTDDLNPENVERFAEALADKPGPFLVHCSSSNRVGAMFALRAHWLEDKSPDEALEIGREAGLAAHDPTHLLNTLVSAG